MSARSTVSAVALAVAVPLLLAVELQAAPGSWTPVEIRKSPTASEPVADAGNTTKPCVWTRLRGWHRSGWLGTWRGCRPGPEWRYERRCWIGPANVRHCRFYG